MSENNGQNTAAEERELNEVLKVRREKLSALRTEGEDPFTITKFERTNHISDIRNNYEYFGCNGRGVYNPKGRDFCQNFKNCSFKQVAASPAREIPRAYKYRFKIQTALC